MPKSQPERPSDAASTAGSVPLSADVRRHLGRNLRSLYADTLTAPVSQRLEDLIARLDKPRT